LEKTLEVMQLELGLAYRVEPQEIEDSDAHVHLLATVGLTEEFERIAADLPLAGSTILKAAQLQQPYVWEVEQNPLPEIRLGLQRYGVALAVTAPLMVKDKLVGAIVLGTRQARSFTTDELALLAAISQQIGVAVENSRLREQAELSAAMAERNRLARELHDSVTQSLYTVTLYAEAANRMLAAEKNIEASQHLRELRNTAQEALREMRLLIFELRPLALEKIGLASALHMRLEAVESRGGIQTELKVRGVEKLPARLQEELYQVATEALNNLLKHAHAQCVTVQLNVDANRIVLEVCDDGIGFDPTAVETGGGFGIAGMKERAHRLGGQLQMISAPGQGTRVRLEAPNASPETANDPFPKWSKR
jgi:signal transduction histidine kinase